MTKFLFAIRVAAKTVELDAVGHPLRLVLWTPRSFGCGSAALRCIADLHSAKRATTPMRFELATPGGLQIRDTAQRGQAATKGARRLRRFSAGPGSASGISRGFGLHTLKRTKAPRSGNLSNARAFSVVLIECNSAIHLWWRRTLI